MMPSSTITSCSSVPSAKSVGSVHDDVAIAHDGFERLVHALGAYHHYSHMHPSRPSSCRHALR